MQSISVFDIGSAQGSIFIDNLMVSSADRLLSTQYRNLEKESGLDNPGIATALFNHDLLNLATLVESIVCHDTLFINAEFIEQWNQNIEQKTLKPLYDIVVPVVWPKEQRNDAEARVRDALPNIEPGSPLLTFMSIVFDTSYCKIEHSIRDSRSIERKLFLPYDEGHMWGTPFYIAMGTAFYLMCSQVIGVPYKPSILRANLLSELIHNEYNSRRFNAAEIAVLLLEKSREKVAEDYFNKILELNIIETHLPCILSAVLKEAKSSADIIPITKQIRDTGEARSFRKWSREFSETIQNGDLANIGEFLKEIDSVTSRVNKFLGLDKDDSVSVSLGWGPVRISQSFSLPKVLHRPLYFKRHLWFLHNMYSTIATMARLSDHIERVLFNYLPDWFQSSAPQEQVWQYLHHSRAYSR